MNEPAALSISEFTLLVDYTTLCVQDTSSLVHYIRLFAFTSQKVKSLWCQVNDSRLVIMMCVCVCVL